MACCQCQGIETLFNRKRAAKDLRRYRKKGPRKTTRILIDAIRLEGVERTTVLDIGGGVGAIQHELLKDGAVSAIAVDASSAYIEAAKEETARQGHAGRVSYFYGDFVEVAPKISEADIVTLDRVICCYHDMETLVKLSSARARKIYGLVYPRDTWWMRLLNPFPNFFLWLTRVPFRIYIYSRAEVDAVVHSNGLDQAFYRKTGLWQVVVYSRS